MKNQNFIKAQQFLIAKREDIPKGALIEWRSYNGDVWLVIELWTRIAICKKNFHLNLFIQIYRIMIAIS